MLNSTYAFIPARSGSLGITDKNLQKVSGISLIKRTFDQAITSDIFEKIIVSTDSFQIISEITSDFSYQEFDQIKEDSLVEISSNTIFHKRRKDQAEKLSPIRDVVFNLVNIIEFGQIWMLQPTSPFREKSEFTALNNLQSNLTAEKKNWSSIVSCKLVNEHPDRMYKVNGDYITHYTEQLMGDNAPRQLLEKLYVKDGGFYILKRDYLLRKLFLGPQSVAFVRQGFKTINIDEPIDLFMAQLIGKNLNEN
jgi:N-acylneuraminate cytidylyltransferase